MTTLAPRIRVRISQGIWREGGGTSARPIKRGRLAAELLRTRLETESLDIRHLPACSVEADGAGSDGAKGLDGRF